MEFKSDARHSKNCPGTCFCAAAEEKRALLPPSQLATVTERKSKPSLLDTNCAICESPVASFLQFCACGADFKYHPPIKL